jgi:hypothetical protein
MKLIINQFDIYKPMGKKTLFEKVLQKMTHSKDKTPSGLSKYPLVVLGSHMGGILTHSISNKTHGAVPMLNINQMESSKAYHIRSLYEQKRVKNDDFITKGNPIQFLGYKKC